MNKELSSCSSSTINSIRKAGIGLRGGLTVRGGKLPSSSQNALQKKKTVAPKIPIKREKVKKEEHRESTSHTYIKKERDFQDYRGRGRGRGRAAKVYIQTEGTLLGDGPALILKRERERERINIPRYSKSSGVKSEDGKVNPRDVDYLLECYDDALSESDSDEDLKPIKYPLAKLEKEKTEIKKEVIDQEDVKTFIKVEPPDEDFPLISSVKVEKEESKVDIKPKHFGNTFIEDILKLEGEDFLMVLLQLPSSLPFQSLSEGPEKSNKKKIAVTGSESKLDEEKRANESNKTLRLCDLPDCYLGKFQVLKSGRMRLVLGSTYLYLESAVDSRCLATVVSIPLDKKEGDLINLGRVTQKLILRPHFSGITD